MGSISPAFVSITGNVNIAPATGLTSAAQISILSGATTTIAANTSRKRIRVMNLTSSTNSVFIGSAAGFGGELVPGVWIDIHDTAAIPLFNPGPATVNIGYEEYT